MFVMKLTSQIELDPIECYKWKKIVLLNLKKKSNGT